jgi:ribose 5-phosphate isomerase RpiB
MYAELQAAEVKKVVAPFDRGVCVCAHGMGWLMWWIMANTHTESVAGLCRRSGSA